LDKFTLKMFVKSDAFPFFIFIVGMVIIHLLAPIPIADDVYFRTNPNGIFDWAFLRGRYFNWSSRLIIEFFVVAFLKLPSIIWRILNPIILGFSGIAISKLFVEKTNRSASWLIVFLLFIYPYREMLSAGWVTISINYLWPLTFGLLALVTLKKIILNKSTTLAEYILSGFLLLFAVNQEIMAASLLIVFLAAAAYLIVKKRPHWFVFLGLVLCIGSLIFTFMTPGNVIRRNVETRWFIDFNNISLVEKLEIGISSTLAQYIFNFNFLFFIFSLLLFIAVFKKYEEPLFKIFASLPLAMSLIFGNAFHVIIDRLFPHLALIDTEMSKYGLITLGNFTNLQSYIPFFLLFLTAFIIIILVYLEFENTWKTLLSIGVLLVGLLSRLILAFSPTIYASGYRTHFLLLISIIICSVMVFQNISRKKAGQFMDNLLIGFGFIAGFSYLNLLMSL